MDVEEKNDVDGYLIEQDEVSGREEDSDPSEPRLVNVGRKKNRGSNKWKRNVQKQRPKGKSYLAKQEDVTVHGKKFSSQCCHESIDKTTQNQLFCNLYDLTNKTCQDLYISGCMFSKDSENPL